MATVVGSGSGRVLGCVEVVGSLLGAGEATAPASELGAGVGVEVPVLLGCGVALRSGVTLGCGRAGSSGSAVRAGAGRAACWMVVPSPPDSDAPVAR